MSGQIIKLGAIEADVDLTAPIDLSLPVSDSGTTAWGIPAALIAPFEIGDFVGSVRTGGSVNFNDIRFNPHAHGTHTESCGHVLREVRSLTLTPPPAFQFAQLLTVHENGMDARGGILEHCFEGDVLVEGIAALILCLDSQETGGSTSSGKADTPVDWSGTNPPYLSASAMSTLVSHGINHLLINLPSVDPEEDGGALLAHRIFWGIDENREQGPDFRPDATITELLSIPPELKDGIYLLNLQIGPIVNDACPSRPVVFPTQVLR